MVDVTEGPGSVEVPDRMRDLVLAVDAYRRAYADVLGLGVGEVLTLSDLGREGARPVAILAARLGVTAPAGTAVSSATPEPPRHARTRRRAPAPETVSVTVSRTIVDKKTGKHVERTKRFMTHDPEEGVSSQP